jgi:ATP-dependent Clp protease ATP-binding subunit ClpC
VVAGQKYIGELEERVGALGAALETEGAVWVLPSFADAYWAGRHHDSPRGLLDLVLPLAASGRIRIVGELDAGQYERLAALRPSLRAAFDTVTIQPLGPAESLEVARRWVGRLDGQATEAWEGVLARRSSWRATTSATSGCPARCCGSSTGRAPSAAADPQRTGPPAPEDLLAVVSTRTGVPLDLLDDRRPLDLDDLRAFFARRVLGQDEAVTALVDRVAMIKAGLTDPTRPQGVFLFVGPTGTGKTEIAKALAERLFGSPDRLLRLDMSEFQTADSLVRLTGAAGPGESGEALVDQIRARPFSVVLSTRSRRRTRACGTCSSRSSTTDVSRTPPAARRTSGTAWWS